MLVAYYKHVNCRYYKEQVWNHCFTILTVHSKVHKQTKHYFPNDCILHRKIKIGQDQRGLQKDLHKFQEWAD